MTAVSLQHPLETPASDFNREDPPALEISEVLNGDDNHSRKKHKKKNKDKRSLSCSTDASSCSTSSKRKKKKKKHHRRSLDEPPSPKVNPIFLWVKEDNAKIVEVRCEDYDRRNRIKLTKTAGGWRAIPHVEIQEWQTPEPLKVPKTEPGGLPPKLEPISHDELVSCDEFVSHKMESVESPVPVRGETPPPKLEMCKTEHDPLFETECREMPPLEPQTNVSPRESFESVMSRANESPRESIESLIPETTSIAVEGGVDMKDDHSSPAQPDQYEPIHPIQSSDAAPPEIVNAGEKTGEDTTEDDKQCAVKCCDEVPSNNVDENHNNEFDSDPRSSCMIEPSTFCQDVEEILGAIENHTENRPSEVESSQSCAKDVDEYDHSALMTELEEMMNERLKHENSAHKDVLDDIYTFVPSPEKSHEKPKPKETRPTSKIERVIEAVKAKTACAMMAKVNSSNSDPSRDPQGPTQLKTCELESLDLLWRLPEGTTIHHSKLNDEKEPEQVMQLHSAITEATTATISLVKPATPVVTSPVAIPSLVPSQPVQEEPLNLGKPRRSAHPVTAGDLHSTATTLPQLLKKEALPTCKVETKHFPMPHPMDSDAAKAIPKMAERFTPEPSKSTEPLAQLKEIMSDPDVTVPDPLLVPKERLSALIANPKREIPRLMALTNEVKYPKLDTNLMEVSLAHLQLLLQSSKKEDELKLIQKHADLLQSHLKNDASAMDPATVNALNQMLWFPYISHLDVGRGSNPQDLMGMMNMMYPYNGWGQQTYDYAQQSHLMNFWQDMAQKPNLGGGAGVNKGYGDLYKTIPPVVPPSLYTSAPTMGSQARQATSYHSRPAKRRHHRSSQPQAAPDFLKSSPDFLRSAPDFIKTPFDWVLPQTSEGRMTGHRAPHSRPETSTLPASTTSSTPVSCASSPKLKVRKFDVDPNAVPKLINKNLTAAPLPPLSALAHQVPSRYYDSNHLWNPLYGASETREPDYTSSGHWNWTTPVTVSGK